jgi:hypothetical protein
MVLPWRAKWMRRQRCAIRKVVPRSCVIIGGNVQRATVMLPERAALVVIKIARMLINLSFTTQLIGLCTFASHLLHRKKHEVLSFSDCAALCQLALASHMNFPGTEIGPAARKFSGLGDPICPRSGYRAWLVKKCLISKCRP